MTGYTVHTGTSLKFSSGWDRVFQGTKSAKSAATPVPAAKATPKKAVKKTVKKAAAKAAPAGKKAATKKAPAKKNVKRGK